MEMRRGLWVAGVTSVLCIVLLSGCDKQANQSNEGSAAAASVSAQDEIVIEGVRRYYKSQGWGDPVRIVIRDRTGPEWRVNAGAEAKEAGLFVDPQTGEVRKFIPGY